MLCSIVANEIAEREAQLTTTKSNKKQQKFTN